MSPQAHALVALLTAGAVAFIVRLVRRRQLRAKYSLLWLSIGVVLVVLAAWPALLDRASAALGIAYPPAAFLLVAVAFLLVLVVHFSWELSRVEDRLRALAEELALLQAEVRPAPPDDARPPPADRPLRTAPASATRPAR